MNDVLALRYTIIKLKSEKVYEKVNNLVCAIWLPVTVFWPALSITFFCLVMICCKFFTLLFITLLLSDPFIMLTQNAKTSMNSTGKDANTGKDADPSNTTGDFFQFPNWVKNGKF